MTNGVVLEATTLVVTSTAADGTGSLRAALVSADDGDTIDATGISGIITLTGGQLVVSNSVTFLGPGPANPVVDGNGADRVLWITESLTVTLAGLTITNGFVTDTRAGGGILNDHSTLTVSNCVVSGNTAFGGGGIWNYGDSGSGTQTEVIRNLGVFTNLVTVSIQSLSNCPSFFATMVPSKATFPIPAAPLKKLTLAFEATFDCVNDPLASSSTTVHNDYRVVAIVHQEAIDGFADSFLADDTCPRDPLGSVPHGSGTIVDNGCGGKKPDGTLGADVFGECGQQVTNMRAL